MRKLMVLLALILPLPVSAQEEEDVRGRLCLRAPGETAIVERCQSVVGRSFDITPAEVDRGWIWYSRNYDVLALGTVDQGSVSVTLPEESFSISLEVEGSPDREWPQVTTIAIGPRNDPDFWTIEVSNIWIDRLREVFLPDGTWSISLKADRHSIETLEPVRLVDDSWDLGMVELDPLPQIRGTVIDLEGELLSAAMVIALDGTPLTRSGLGGEIFYEAPCVDLIETCELPEWFRLEYPGTAPAWFRVPYPDRDFDLGVVRMAPGAAIALEIDRRLTNATLTVEVIDDPLPVPPLDFYPTIDSINLRADQDSLLIENLPEGMIRLDVKGDRSGQYLSEYVVLTAGEVLDVKMKIAPLFVTFQVSEGDLELGGARIQVESLAEPGHISHPPLTGANGKTVHELWMEGRYRAHLVDSGGRRGGRSFSTDSISEPVRIGVGDATAYGQVMNEKLEPIPGATVLLSDEFYFDERAASSVTDEEGRYEVHGLLGHDYGVRIIAAGYLDGGGYCKHEGEQLIVCPKPSELKRGTKYTITVRWEETGEPVVGAGMFFPGRDVVPDIRWYTDERGKIELRREMPPLPRSFFIVPLEGSFQSAELFDTTEIEVWIRRPAAPVELFFVDDDGRKTNHANVFFLLNGWRVPDSLPKALEIMQGTRFYSGPAPRVSIERLAPGTYTFYAIQAVSERHLPRFKHPRENVDVFVGPPEAKATLEVYFPEMVCPPGPRQCYYR